jgi:ferredoxin
MPILQDHPRANKWKCEADWGHGECVSFSQDIVEKDGERKRHEWTQERQKVGESDDTDDAMMRAAAKQEPREK